MYQWDRERVNQFWTLITHNTKIIRKVFDAWKEKVFHRCYWMLLYFMHFAQNCGKNVNSATHNATIRNGSVGGKNNESERVRELTRFQLVFYKFIFWEKMWHFLLYTKQVHIHTAMKMAMKPLPAQSTKHTQKYTLFRARTHNIDYGA